MTRLQGFTLVWLALITAAHFDVIYSFVGLLLTIILALDYFIQGRRK